jgi:hypothetical protein
VPKIIVDTFCAKQIARDGSTLTEMGLYPDDSQDFVPVVLTLGSRGTADTTRIEIFACVAM